mmetsp:Transcript_8692/g.12920  ORF Transcript_8692/g.12920 Transcript_8692/m.12920 type:complete len:350 (+) Transcript_8692:1752-2801(+)
MSAKLKRYRAISDQDFPKTITFRIIEANLSINVAKIGSMHPFVRVSYNGTNWKSESSSKPGMNPKWNACHSFTYSGSRTLEFTVYHKNLLIGETEIGKVTLNLNEICEGHETEWWNLTTLEGTMAGVILLSFDIERRAHSSQNSLELGIAQLSPFPKIHRKRSQQFKPNLTQRPLDCNPVRLNTEPEDPYDLEQLKEDLLEENNRLKSQEHKVRKLFDKLKQESTKVREEKQELRRCKETLQLREESILAEKEQMQKEKSQIESEKQELQKLREELSSEYSKLKQEKYKINTHKKLLERTSKQIGDTSKFLAKQKVLLSGSKANNSLPAEELSNHLHISPKKVSEKRGV